MRAPALRMPTASPRVSVVLAVHDQAPWLARTIASVQAQTLSDWELLIVDDGSTDATPDLATGAAAGDARIRHLPGPRRERAVARNRGLAAARAPLIAFLDGDDLWRPEKLARQVDALAAAPDAAFCYTIARFIDASDRALPGRKPPAARAGAVFPALMRANFVILSSVMARRAAVEAAGGFAEDLAPLGCEDWDLWLRLARDAPVAVVDAELTQYRLHAANTAWPALLASGLAVVERHFADPTTPAAARLGRSAACARLHWYHAGAVALADRRAGLTLAATAARLAPATLWSRPAVGALLSLGLPAGLRRRVRGAALPSLAPAEPR